MVLLLACSTARELAAADLPETRALRAAPEGVELEGQALRFSARAWREQDELALRVELQGASGPVPDSVRAERIYVQRGDRVWVSTLTEEQRGPEGVVAVARGGPDWPAASMVDLVLRLRSPEGQPYLARHWQKIEE